MSQAGIIVKWGAEIRDGHCPDCNAFLDVPTAEDKAEWRETKLLKRMCSQCGERKLGKLVVRLGAVEPPGGIDCVRFSCLWKYLLKSLRYVLVSLYHKHRIAYAMSHRDKDIPIRYRTGEPSPDSIWEAVKAILRLKVRR